MNGAKMGLVLVPGKHLFAKKILNWYVE
jgi:hypothetical protein